MSNSLLRVTGHFCTQASQPRHFSSSMKRARLLITAVKSGASPVRATRSLIVNVLISG